MLYFGKMLYPIIDRTLFCSATHSFNISCKCNIWKNAVSYYWPYLHFAQCILFVYCNILVKSCILLLAVLYFVAHLDKNQCRPPTASAFCQMVFFFCLLLYLITVEMWYLVKNAVSYFWQCLIFKFFKCTPGLHVPPQQTPWINYLSFYAVNKLT